MHAIDEAEIKRAVVSMISEIAPEIESESDIDANSNLREQADLDSMDFLNLITGMAKQFEIAVPEKDYSKLVSLNDFVSYVSNQLRT
jgi:acyl carrier protein